MRVGTFNVNSIGARLDFLLACLKDVEPDVLCLQELKVDDGAFPALALEQAGYAAIVHGQPRWNGVAVLARRATVGVPSLVEQGLAGAEDLGARFVCADVGGLRVASVYVPNGKTLEHPDYQEKLRFLDRLGDFCERRDRGVPTLIGGDFNLVPSDLDTYAPEAHRGAIFHTEAERSRYARLLDTGLFDLFREKNPSEEAHSWWDYRGGAFHKRQGLRIDFLLGDTAILERTTSARILRDWRKKHEGLTPSDHTVVLAEITV